MALLDDTLSSGQAGHIVDHQQIAGKLNDIPNVVRDFGAVGNSNNSTLNAGSDDTQAFIDGIAAAAAGPAILVVPGQKTYRIEQTLEVPVGMHILGLGTRRGNGAGGVPMLAWHGATGSGTTVINVETANANIPGNLFQNIAVSGIGPAGAPVNMPDHAIRFRGTGGAAAKPDSGTGFENCWLSFTQSNALQIESLGITNAYWHGGRFDQINGYGVSIKRNSFFQMRDFTFDNWVGAGDDTTGCNGVLKWDADGQAGHILWLDVSGAHIEVNGNLNEVNSGGATEFDKRSVFHFAVNESSATTQVMANFNSVWLATQTNTADHSFILVTSGGTTTQNAERVAFNINQSRIVRTDHTKLLGNVNSGNEYPFSTRPAIAQVVYGVGSTSSEFPMIWHKAPTA